MSPFATFSRQLRKERELLLGDVCRQIGCTPSFLSQIENGSKPIPDNLVGKLISAMSLSPREGSALERAAAMSAKEYRISIPKDARDLDRETAQALSVGFARMSTLKKQKILAILRENEDA